MHNNFWAPTVRISRFNAKTIFDRLEGITSNPTAGTLRTYLGGRLYEDGEDTLSFDALTSKEYDLLVDMGQGIGIRPRIVDIE